MSRSNGQIALSHARMRNERDASNSVANERAVSHSIFEPSRLSSRCQPPLVWIAFSKKFYCPWFRGTRNVPRSLRSSFSFSPRSPSSPGPPGVTLSACHTTLAPLARWPPSGRQSNGAEFLRINFRRITVAEDPGAKLSASCSLTEHARRYRFRLIRSSPLCTWRRRALRRWRQPTAAPSRATPRAHLADLWIPQIPPATA